MVNFLQMQDFLSVAEHQSITKAAQSLCVTQQTLSGHMAALEEELGCQLFHRRPRFSLTYEGECFYRYASQMTETRRAMEQEFADMRRETGGILRVGVSYVRGKVWMPELIAAYHKKLPEMELHVSEGANGQLVRQAISGALDIVLAYVPEQTPELCAEELYREKMLLIAPGQYLTDTQREAIRSGDLRCLSECRFLMNPPGDNAERVGRQLLRQAGILPKSNVTAYSTEILLELCLRGEGICFCPDFMAQTILTPEQKRKLFFCSVSGEYPVSLAWRRGQYIPRPVREFRDVCFSLREQILLRDVSRESDTD